LDFPTLYYIVRDIEVGGRMRQKLIMGNWKMNGCLNEIDNLLRLLVDHCPELNTNTQCVVFPPAIYLQHVQQCLINSPIVWGAQNVYPRDAGAFTGELSGPMLKDYACEFVLVGHSERRHVLHESEKFVAEKFHHVKDHDMIPVLCVGETQEERERGLTEEIISQQLLPLTDKGTQIFYNCVIAYEPVWAIGTGLTASPEQAQEVHEFIRALVAGFDKEAAKNLPIVYGGSVNEKNARSIFAMPDIDGGLVGGASLNAQQFVEIVKCIN
jgi:triosephosphate isomerase